jgi:hypothetical protein
MIVVADTGPINYLIWIGHVAVLPRLYHFASPKFPKVRSF